MSILAPLPLVDMASPALSPDDSSLSAAVSISPSDSENLSPDELELLNKLEEQNRYVVWGCGRHMCFPVQPVFLLYQFSFLLSTINYYILFMCFKIVFILFLEVDKI